MAKRKSFLRVSSPVGRLNHNLMRANFLHGAAEISLHFTAFDAVFDIRFDPILDVPVDAFLANHHGDARAGPEELERRDGRRIFGAHDQDIVVVVRVSFVIVMNDFVEVLTRHVEFVRNIVIAACENDFACPVRRLFGMHGKAAVFALRSR